MDVCSDRVCGPGADGAGAGPGIETRDNGCVTSPVRGSHFGSYTRGASRASCRARGSKLGGNICTDPASRSRFASHTRGASSTRCRAHGSHFGSHTRAA